MEKRSAIRRDGNVAEGGRAEVVERGFRKDDVVKVCKFGMRLLLDRLGFCGILITAR